ncbi:MAG: NAD(P)-dependent dehydrogenase (short-subunit alcohol dehydrogenase family) [Bacteroidia bacterium]|jgi:NAD(P)-dependent dehydrogenase (short-subunit alcohol dehydrogenase family)
MNVIVTGASSGVGYELSKKLIADKRITKVLGIARREERLMELSDYANSINREEVFVSLTEDVCSIPLDVISAHVNRVDALVNNAGYLISKPFMDLTDDDFKAIYEVNLFAPARLIRLLKPMMGGENPSHIVNIGSMGGFQGASKFPGLSAYSSSKSAIAGLSECLAEEFKEDNIKVNCLAFGAVQTEMLEKAFPGFQAPLSSIQMADFVLDFTVNGHMYYNGKVLPISSSTP